MNSTEIRTQDFLFSRQQINQLNYHKTLISKKLHCQFAIFGILKVNGRVPCRVMVLHRVNSQVTNRGSLLDVGGNAEMKYPGGSRKFQKGCELGSKR